MNELIRIIKNKMKPLKIFILLMLSNTGITVTAQNNATPKWLGYKFSNKVSLQTALIKIDNKDASYPDLMNISDSNLLKVELYSKKQAQQIVGKDEAKNGLVLVTLHKKHYPPAPVTTDSVVFIIGDNGDTIYCKNAQPAMLGDTANVQWIQFLQHKLNAMTPADNGAPAGLYNVDIMFLVNKDGSVSDVEVLEDPGYGTAAEVRKLMNKSPVWTPAICNEHKVVYRQKERITFFVSEE